MGRYVTPSGSSSAGRIKKQREFKVSGTFTPSAKLLAAGGSVTVRCIGGGGAGGHTYLSQNEDTVGRGGGSSGMDITRIVTVTGPVTVTIGAGGYNTNSGGNTTFGTLLKALGGKSGGSGFGGRSTGEGSIPGEWPVLIKSATSTTVTVHRSGAGGGAGGGSPYHYQYQPWTQNISGEPNSGGGGGGGGTGGAQGYGGSGLCIVTWEE